MAVLSHPAFRTVRRATYSGSGDVGGSDAASLVLMGMGAVGRRRRTIRVLHLEDKTPVGGVRAPTSSSMKPGGPGATALGAPRARRPAREAHAVSDRLGSD